MAAAPSCHHAAWGTHRHTTGGWQPASPFLLFIIIIFLFLFFLENFIFSFPSCSSSPNLSSRLTREKTPNDSACPAQFYHSILKKASGELIVQGGSGREPRPEARARQRLRGRCFSAGSKQETSPAPGAPPGLLGSPDLLEAAHPTRDTADPLPALSPPGWPRCQHVPSSGSCLGGAASSQGP